MERTNIIINVVDRNYGSKASPDAIVVHKYNRLTIGSRVCTSLGVAPDDFIIVGEFNGSWYISKKPQGQFAGYRLRVPYKTATFLEVSSKALKGMPMGSYHLGAKIVDGNDIEWFPIVKEN